MSKFIFGMTWGNPHGIEHSYWGFWTDKKVVVDCSKWNTGASILMARNIFKK